MANRYGSTYEYNKFEKAYETKYRHIGVQDIGIQHNSNVSPLSTNENSTDSGSSNHPSSELTIHTEDGKSRTFKTIVHVREYKEAMQRKEKKRQKTEKKAASEKKKDFIKNWCGHENIYPFFKSTDNSSKKASDTTVATLPSFASAGDGTDAEVSEKKVGNVGSDEENSVDSSEAEDDISEVFDFPEASSPANSSSVQIIEKPGKQVVQQKKADTSMPVALPASTVPIASVAIANEPLTLPDDFVCKGCGNEKELCHQKLFGQVLTHEVLSVYQEYSESGRGGCWWHGCYESF